MWVHGKIIKSFNISTRIKYVSGKTSLIKCVQLTWISPGEKYSCVSSILPTLTESKTSTCLIKLWHHPHQNLRHHRHHRLLVFLQEGRKDGGGTKGRANLIRHHHLPHKCHQSTQFFALESRKSVLNEYLTYKW